MAKVANLKSSIQSKIQQDVTSQQQKTASSTQATQAGSTTTPEVTSTPKVTQTAKAMPSITQRPEITPVSIQTPSVTQPNVRNLLGTIPLRKAATPDLLSKAAEEKDIRTTTLPLNLVRASIKSGGQVEATVNESLYQQGLDWINNKFGKLEEARKSITDTVGKTAIDMFKGVGEDLSTQWKEGKGLGLTKDAVLNTVQGLPRGIARIEYGLSELLDWGIDAKRATNLKDSIKRDLDYWENTRTYKKIQGTESFSDFLKNPLMYAGGTLTEMLPMFINAWVAVPTTYAQMYGDTYRDYAEDESLQDLTDNQIRLMATGVAGVNTIIELGADLVQGIMPWTKTAAKGTEREVRRALSKPFSNLIKKIVKGGTSEGVEEVLQNEIQDQVAGFAGSDRELPTRGSRLTTFGISAGVGGILQGGNVVVDIKRHKELQTAFNEWSEAVDNIAPGVSKSDKEKLFSAIVAAEIQDANMSEKSVNKYEAQTTELYNRIDELTKELETTTDETRKTEINRQIEDANQKIKNIDEIINSANKVTEEVNAKLQELSNQKEIEELHAEINKSMGGENLSEQTMKTSEDKSVVSSTPIEDMDNDKLLDARKFWIINKPQTPQERKRQKDIENEMEIRMNNYKLPDSTKTALRDRTFDIDNMSIWETKAAIKELDRLKKEAREEKRYDDGNDYTHLKRKVQDKLKDLLRMDEERDEAKTEQRDKESILPDTPIDDKDFFDKWSNKININKYALKVFLLDRKYIPGLKGIKISGVEDLSESEIMEVAKNAATVAGILGIDFNKVLDLANVEFSVLNLKGEDVKGTEDISGKLYLEASKYYDILKMAIILKDTGPSVFGHELMHLLDKEYLYRNGKLWTSGNNISRASILKDASFKTYNVPYLGYKFDDKDYWDTSREILARFAEQYIAKQVDEREYKALTGREFYWSDKEFNKLVPKFEKIIARFSEFMLDKGDKINYPEIMRKMADLQYKQTQFSLGDESQMRYELIEMKRLYDDIQNSIGDIKDETIRLEMEAELSTLYSNYEMLNKMKDEYIQKQKTSPQIQDNIDGIVETVIPNPSENPQTIRLGLPYYGGSNIENGIGQISEGNPEGETTLNNSNIDNRAKVKINKKNKEIKIFFSELGQAWHDAFTPVISRIYNISPRIAGRLITMEAQTDINIHRYRQKAKGFVETLGKLKGKQALEVKMALLDYGALASEQGENIEQYKKDEVAKLKEVLLRNGFKEQDINDMFSVLDDIGRQYEAAGLSINLTDIYFPRSVIDYEGLIDYMSRVSGQNIALNKITLLKRIRDIQNSDKSDAEKEAGIRRAITNDFKQPGTTSQNAKERKIGLLSDWGEGIYEYYANPIESLDHYIVSMTNAIQRQLFLGGIKQDSQYEGDILNQTTSESISNIIDKLVADGMISDEDLEELKHSVLSVLNKKKSPKAITAMKNITYITTITNFLSALNQLDDLGMSIIKDKSGLKNVVKAIFGKANIKYDDLGLDDAYEMFREEGKMTNWLFSKSFFNAIDRLGKTSFVNAAWESLIRQYSNEKTREYLHTRLVAMYGEEAAKRMEEKIKSKDYKGDNGQIDIEILRDLLYQLGSTQPIFTSAMPTAYLNHPWVRLCYALSSFTIKRIDWLVQGTKEVNAKHGKVAAGAWLMGVTFYLALFGAAVGDIGDFLKGKKDETFLWQLIDNGIEDALKTRGEDMITSRLKIWDLSEYDLKIYQWQGLKGVVASKIAPFIFDLGDDVIQAIWKHDLDETTDLVKYIPIFGKLVYYNGLQDIGKETKKEDDEWDFGGEEEWDFSGEEEWDFSGEEEWDFS